MTPNQRAVLDRLQHEGVRSDPTMPIRRIEVQTTLVAPSTPVAEAQQSGSPQLASSVESMSAHTQELLGLPDRRPPRRRR